MAVRRTPSKSKARKRGAAHGVSAAGGAERSELRTLVEQNYAMLRAIAARKLRRSSLSRSMSPTSLVAEGIVRLMKQRSVPASAPHLSGLATILMAQALSDRAKTRRASKRNAGSQVVSIGLDVPQDKRLDRSAKTAAPEDEGRSRLVQEMERVGRTHPRRMEVVTLHLVLGIPLAEVARMLSVSERTAFRELAAGRASLAAALGMLPSAREDGARP